MSSGEYVADNRIYASEENPVLYGNYFYKKWDGGDQQDKTGPFEEHPYTMQLYEFNNPLVTYRLTPESDLVTQTFQQACGNGPIVHPIWEDNDSLKLFGKASKKIRDNDFNGDAFIAEGHQVMNLLATTATRLATFIESVRHGNVYKAASALSPVKVSTGRNKIVNTLNRHLDRKNIIGTASDAILEVQYGWRPLLRDAFSFGEAIGHIATKVPHQSYKVRRQISSSGTSQSNVRFQYQSTIGVALKITVIAEPMAREILHMNDPLAALWEVTPASFIADWFLPIGDYLQALNFSRALHVNSIVRSEIHKSSVVYISDLGNFYSLSGAGSYFEKSVQLTRTLGTSPSLEELPTPNFKSFSKALSPEHVLNAFALLGGTASRFNKSLKF